MYLRRPNPRTVHPRRVRWYGLNLTFENAVKNERKLFADCIKSHQREGLIHAFFSERAVNKIPELKLGKPKTIKKIGVIGGGTMGTGISMAALNSGFSVVMIEQDQNGLDKAFEKIVGTYDRNINLGRMSNNDKDSILNNFKGDTDLNTLSDRDLIIEAVFEEMEVKKDVFKKLNSICSNETILATNTSYLNVNEIAEVVSSPERVIGLHYFSPANIMKL